MLTSDRMAIYIISVHLAKVNAYVIFFPHTKNGLIQNNLNIVIMVIYDARFSYILHYLNMQKSFLADLLYKK